MCQILNLFEIAIRLRKEGVVPREVFGSWVIWYYEVINSPHFEQIWDEVMPDYTSDLRSIINKGISLSHTVPDENARLRDFFSHVAHILDCREVSRWLKRIEKERDELRKKKLEICSTETQKSTS